MYEYIKNDYYILVLSKISIQSDFSIVLILDLPPCLDMRCRLPSL